MRNRVSNFRLAKDHTRRKPVGHSRCVLWKGIRVVIYDKVLLYESNILMSVTFFFIFYCLHLSSVLSLGCWWMCRRFKVCYWCGERSCVLYNPWVTVLQLQLPAQCLGLCLFACHLPLWFCVRSEWYLCDGRTQISCFWSTARLNFARWGRHYVICFMSPSWPLEFWGGF